MMSFALLLVCGRGRCQKVRIAAEKNEATTKKKKKRQQHKTDVISSVTFSTRSMPEFVTQDFFLPHHLS